jgi:serine protease
MGLLFAACGGGSDPGTTITPPPPPPPPPVVNPATINGTIGVYLPQAENVLESEPNDSFDQAQFLGEFRPGRSAALIGYADSDQAGDPTDGYRFLAPERVRITVDLEFQSSAPAEFVVGVFDFSGLQYVEVFSSASSPIQGEFHAKGIVDLVVAPSQGDGDYVLTLSAEALGSRIEEREPNDNFYEGQYVGEVLVDDRVVVRGEAHTNQDPYDSVTLACPSAVKLDLLVFIPDTGLPEVGEFDLLIYDITGGEQDPPLVDQAFWDGNIARVEVEIAAGSLIQAFVSAIKESATHTLVIRGKEPDGSGSMTTALTARSAEPYWRARLVPSPDYGLPSAPLVVGEALVVPRAGRTDAVALDLERTGCRALTSMRGRRTKVGFDVPANLSEEDRRRYTIRAVRCLARASSLAHAEPNFLYQPHAEPDDTHYGLQWHYPLINLTRAWDITTGDNDVIVAVIDTGAGDHPDLEPRHFDGYDFISNAVRARDGDGRDSDPTDEGDLGLPNGTSTFHGTHVAGTVGAVTDNGTGVAGVTWRTRIMHLRALGVGGGTSDDIAQSILYAAGLQNDTGELPSQPAHIINMSLGGGGFSDLMNDAVQDAVDAGVVVFASSGNSNTSTPGYPASYDHVVSVGAVDALGLRSYYSNYGSTLDIVAPGGDVTADQNSDGWPDGVLSTRMLDSSLPPQPVYTFFQGTSMASPHAAGVAALMLAEDPDLTPAQIEQILKDTALDSGDVGVDAEYGHGLIDAYAALLSVVGAGPPNIPPELKLSTSALSFPPEESSRRILISNVGGQILNVDTPTIVVHTPQEWLKAVLLPPTVGAANTAGMDLTVDRTGLGDGAYFGRVALDSDGGSANVQVLMRVQTGPPAPPDVEIFVRVVNVDSGEVARQVFVNPSSSLDFELDQIPPGTYRLEAGSDTNGNGILCEAGELCGVYPLAESPVLITLLEGDERGPFEFTVSPPAVLPSGK